MPEAMAISSTTLRSRCSFGSLTSGETRVAPRDSATLPPPDDSIAVLNPVAPMITRIMTRATRANSPEWASRNVPNDIPRLRLVNMKVASATISVTPATIVAVASR